MLAWVFHDLYCSLTIAKPIVYIFLVGGTVGKGHMYTVMGINVHIYKVMQNFDYGFPITLDLIK
jgi:hypothetical protein